MSDLEITAPLRQLTCLTCAFRARERAAMERLIAHLQEKRGQPYWGSAIDLDALLDADGPCPAAGLEEPQAEGPNPAHGRRALLDEP